MFLFKKVVGPMFSPLPICLELLFVGVVLLLFTRKQRLGKMMVTLAGIMLVLISSEGTAGRLLHTLEAPYPRITAATIQMRTNAAREGAVQWIVVLAGGVAGDPSLPIQLQLTRYSRVRLLEGIRLYHLIPRSKLVLTGGLGHPSEPEATVLGRFAQALGVKKSDIVHDVQSRDSKDHPQYVSRIVQGAPFILVTSAFHMPRALGLFAKQGMTPIPAPVGHWEPPQNAWPDYYFPNASGVRLAELAFHEYIGLGWAWVRGQI